MATLPGCAKEATYGGKPVSFWVNQLKDKNLEFRKDAVEVLRKLGPDVKGVASALVEALKDDSPNIRRAAANALADFKGTGESVPALIDALKDPVADVRRITALALGHIGAEAQAVALIAGPALTSAMTDPDIMVCIEAAGARGKIGYEPAGAVQFLIQHIRSPDVHVYASAATKLQCMGPNRKLAVPGLIQMLSDPSKGVRHSAMLVLGDLGSDAADAVPALKRAATDGDTSLRIWAKMAVEQIQGK